MITDSDIKKLEAVFATKAELKSLETRMNSGFVEIVAFIGDVKDEIMREFYDFRKEINEFRIEVRESRKETHSILHNHESRVSRLEYVSK